jgi:hypothetical protein
MEAKGAVMCLACELDALWYAEWERLATEGSAPADGQAEAGVESGVPQSQIREWAEGAGEAPAVPDGAGGTPAAPGDAGKPAVPRSGFFCEEVE